MRDEEIEPVAYIHGQSEEGDLDRIPDFSQVCSLGGHPQLYTVGQVSGYDMRHRCPSRDCTQLPLAGDPPRVTAARDWREWG